jgi:hypothetical protein
MNLFSFSAHFGTEEDCGVGYSEEKADVKTLVEILKDLFFEKHLALTVDFDE